MRVALTSRFAADQPGGIETVVRELAPRLSALRPDWDVATVHAFERPTRSNAIPFLGDLSAALALARRVRGFDAVVVNGAEYAWPLLAGGAREHTIVAWHGTRAGEVPALVPRMSLSVRSYWLLEIALQALALPFPRHIVVGPSVSAELRRWYRTDRSAQIVTNGASSLASLERSPIRGRLLWIGTTPHKKGLDIAIDAVRSARARRPDLTLRVVGLPRQSASLPAEPWIDAAGPVPPETMPLEYARAELLLAPTRYEGCSMAILEAMHARIPIVASPSVHWMLGATPLAARDFTAAAFSDALDHALTTPCAGADAVTSATEALIEFSWDRTARGYAQAIESLRLRS